MSKILIEKETDMKLYKVLIVYWAVTLSLDFIVIAYVHFWSNSSLKLLHWVIILIFIIGQECGFEDQFGANSPYYVKSVGFLYFSGDLSILLNHFVLRLWNNCTGKIFLTEQPQWLKDEIKKKIMALTKLVEEGKGTADKSKKQRNYTIS